MNVLKELWKSVEDKYIGGKRYFFLSPSHYSIYYNFAPVLKKYVKGSTLDLGAGRLTWKYFVEETAARYFSTDMQVENRQLSFVTNGTQLAVKERVFDTVICLQVLEHTQKPALILQETARVLKNGGYALISFPHLSYIHGEPHDYFRFTLYGFKSLCPLNLEIEQAHASGGLIAFTSTPIFILLHVLFHKLPLANRMVYYALALLSLIVFHVDRIAGIKGLYPLNYICCLKKI